MSPPQEPDDGLASMEETAEPSERRPSARPGSRLLDLLSPELIRIGPRLLARRETSVPAAMPLPRGPSVLSLYGIADLLTSPGCPVCRYVLTGVRDRLAGGTLPVAPCPAGRHDDAAAGRAVSRVR